MEMDRSVEKVLADELTKIRLEIPFIHRGGCGIFAVLLWDMLSFTGYITEPVELYDGYPIWTRNHIILKYNGKFIDSLGIHHSTDWMGLSVEKPISMKDLNKRAWSDDHWLKGKGAFDRKDIIKLKSSIHKLGYRIGEEKKRMEIKNLALV